MTAALQQLILGVTMAGILAVLAGVLISDGALQEVIRLAAGLLVIAVVLQTVREIRLPSLSNWLRQLAQGDGQTTVTKEESGELLQVAIFRRLDAYVVQKAASLGISCTAEVKGETVGNGAFTLTSVTVHYASGASQEAMGALSASITQELGVPKSAQVFMEEAQK